MLPRTVRRAVSRAVPEVTFTTFSRPFAVGVNNSNINNSSVSNAKPFEEIPSFRSFPVIGTSWIYYPIIGKYSTSKMHQADADKYQKFGNVVRERIGNFDLVSCYHPEDIETVLRSEGKYPDKGEFTCLKVYREMRKEWYKTTGIMILQGHEWQDLRSKVQPHIMKTKYVDSFVGAMQDISQDLVRRILFLRDENSEIPDVLPELYKWALESIGCVSLDARLGCLDNDLNTDSETAKLIAASQTMLHCMDKLEAFAGNIQWWKYFPSLTWNKFVKASDYFTRTALKYINLSFEKLQKNSNEESELTMLQSMLRTPGLDTSGVVITSIDMLFAGIDTTSHSEGFLLYHLATNLEKQEKLHDEIKRVLPTPADKITPAVLDELRYLKACLKESIRLQPIVRGLFRKLDRDVVLSGYKVPAGINIFCLLQTANRLDKNYPNASQYVPERWLDKENKPNPYLSHPFGIGVRSCIGRRLAEQEMWCVTIEIIRRFRVEYHGEEVDLTTGVIGMPDKPLKFKFIDRA